MKLVLRATKKALEQGSSLILHVLLFASSASRATPAIPSPPSSCQTRQAVAWRRASRIGCAIRIRAAVSCVRIRGGSEAVGPCYQAEPSPRQQSTRQLPQPPALSFASPAAAPLSFVLTARASCLLRARVLPVRVVATSIKRVDAQGLSEADEHLQRVSRGGGGGGRDRSEAELELERFLHKGDQRSQRQAHP
eukprot:761188-Hanusia_phi.AAC.1